MTPEQKDILMALRGIEIVDRQVYDLENELKVLEWRKAEAQSKLDKMQDRVKGVLAHYNRCLQRAYGIEADKAD